MFYLGFFVFVFVFCFFLGGGGGRGELQGRSTHRGHRGFRHTSPLTFYNPKSINWLLLYA